MKKVLSICLAFALFLGLLPMNVSASEVEYNALQGMEDAIRQNSKAVIKDSAGNVLEVLELEFDVEPFINPRAMDDAQYYKVTCAAKATDKEKTDIDPKDGYMAALTMVFKDIFGPDNQLVSVYGYFANEESDTYNRRVTYASYDTNDKMKERVPEQDVEQKFSYTPDNFMGFTFRAWATADIVKTGNEFYMYVSTYI